MATTINSYSVGLTLDASAYIKNAGLTATETRKLRRAIEESRTPAEKFTLEQTKLAEAFKRGAIDLGTYSRLFDTATAKYMKAQQAAASLAEANNRVATSTTQAATATERLARTNTDNVSLANQLTTRVRGLIAAYAGLHSITKVIRLAIDFEQAEARFDVLTGSVENSRVLMKQLRELAASTPLTFTGVSQAAQTMLSFGVSLNDVTRNLQMLGAVSGANEERFKMMTLAFSQMSAAGRLQGQDLLQMVNAGFNPLQQIAEKTGETMMQLRKRMEEGGISSQEVTEAFVAATSEGGRYNGMLERIADTMGGRLSIAISELQVKGIEAGKALEPLITQLTKGVNDGASALDHLITLLGLMSDGLAGLVALVQDIFSNIFDGNSFTRPFERFNDLLDRMDSRDRELAAENDPTTKIDEAAAAEAAAANAAAQQQQQLAEAAQKNYDEELAKLKERNIELRYGEQMMKRYKMLQEGYTEQQILQLEHLDAINRKLEEQAKAREKAEKDAVKAEQERKKELERLANEANKAFEQNITNAIDAARKHFEKERERAEKIRDEIAKGPGAGIEAGSAEAASFMAQQANARIAGMTVGLPQQTEPTQDQLLAEARKQFAIAEQQKRQNDEANRLLKLMLEEARKNGFQRIR